MLKSTKSKEKYTYLFEPISISSIKFKKNNFKSYFNITIETISVLLYPKTYNQALLIIFISNYI